MDLYVSRIVLEVNGQQVDDFDKVTVKEVETRKPVHLARKTGYVNVTERPQITVEYVIPANSPEFDFKSVENGTLTIDYENGTRVSYSGVTYLKAGDVTYGDGDNPAKRTIDLGADPLPVSQ